MPGRRLLQTHKQPGMDGWKRGVRSGSATLDLGMPNTIDTEGGILVDARCVAWVLVGSLVCGLGPGG